jgi:predicted DNA-binding transcriptional regulator
VNLLVETLQKRVAELETELEETKRTLRRADNAVFVMGLEREEFKRRAWAAEDRLRQVLPIEECLHPDCPPR